MTSWTHKIKLGLTTVVTTLIVGALAGCFGDSSNPSAPLASPTQAHFAKAPSPQDPLAQGLLWDKARDKAVTVSKVISSKGGIVDIGSTGMQLIVPRGAVSADTRFAVTALPGSVVAYDFEPHGAVFLQPLKFVQSLDPTNFKRMKLPAGFNASLDGAYFASTSLIDQTTGIAQVQELIPAESNVTLTGKSLSFPIWHFSGYIISTGRSAPR